MCKLYKEKIMYVEACGSVIQFLKSRSSRFIRCSFGENGKNGKFPGNYWSFVFLYKQFWPRDSDFTNERISTTWQLLFYTSGTKNAQLLGFLAIPRHARQDFCLLSVLPIPLLKKKTILWSSRPEVFCKKGILWNFAKSTGKHLCQSLFFNKVAGHRYFRNFLENVFLQNTYGRCFWMFSHPQKACFRNPNGL